jgi:hypothetical protein
MNGHPFTSEEDAVILANPMLGAHRLARLLGRPYQSCRDRRERLFDYAPPYIPHQERQT